LVYKGFGAPKFQMDKELNSQKAKNEKVKNANFQSAKSQMC
jgi:hypothetical protein